jgi:hypothetical protein
VFIQLSLRTAACPISVSISQRATDCPNPVSKYLEVSYLVEHVATFSRRLFVNLSRGQRVVKADKKLF